MRDSSQIAYAQARVQARFSNRPTEVFWRELEAGRELLHLIEFVRPSALGAAVGSVSTTVDGHAIEARLRDHWSAACAEVAAWYPPAWRPAMRWLAWLPWIAGLEWLARDQPAPGWMQDATLFDGLAPESPEARAERLLDGPLAALAGAFGSGLNLAVAWHAQWRDQWPPANPRLLRGLDQLDATLGDFLPGSAELDAAPFDAAVDMAEATTKRVFRRFAGTPVAGLSLLVLLALDHARLRAALVGACWFGLARAA
jgi:hypothetical protein